MTDKDGGNERNDRLHSLAVAARRDGGPAMHALLTELAPLLRRYCSAQLARSNRRDWAEDMVQEIMLTVHLKLHTFDATMPFTAWLYAVAKHKIIDFVRRERMPQVSIDAAADVADTVSEDPAVRRDLSQLLAQLKPPAGEIIHALKVEGVSVKALAEKFAMSESNIKIIVHRGLRRLAETLTRESV